jgi:hypothetical protein
MRHRATHQFGEISNRVGSITAGTCTFSGVSMPFVAHKRRKRSTEATAKPRSGCCSTRTAVSLAFEPFGRHQPTYSCSPFCLRHFSFNRSVNRLVSHYLFRISTANLNPPRGSFLKNGLSRSRNRTGELKTSLLKYGNWKTIGPNLPPNICAVPTNSSNSLSHSTRTFSCVIVRGTLSEKMKPGGFLSAQLRTASIVGQR